MTVHFWHHDDSPPSAWLGLALALILWLVDYEDTKKNNGRPPPFGAVRTADGERKFEDLS
jgi:hypothetical protein